MFLLLYLFASALPFLTKSFYGDTNKLINSNNAINDICNGICNGNGNCNANAQKMKLSMLDYNPFVKLLDYNLDLTKYLNLQPMHIDKQFERGNLINDSGVIYNYCYSNKDFRKVRFTYLDGKTKFQYFGLVLHPIYNYDMPIFNFEVILYNNDKTVYTLNMIKMDNSKKYNEKYVKPFMNCKKTYPDLQENMAVKLSGYKIFGNYISEAILLGKFTHKQKDINATNEIYDNIIIPSFTEYISIYLDLIKDALYINSVEEIESIKNRHKLFDMKKAFVESRYDIRKCFNDDWYRSMVYDFFYELELESEV